LVKDINPHLYGGADRAAARLVTFESLYLNDPKAEPNIIAKESKAKRTTDHMLAQSSAPVESAHRPDKEQVFVIHKAGMPMPYLPQAQEVPAKTM